MPGQVRHQLAGGKLLVRLHLPQIRRLPHQDEVGVFKGRGVGRLEDAAPGGVGAGLEDRHQAACRVALAHRRQGHGHRGGMVGEILQDQHPLKFPGHLLTLVDALEAGQGLP